jgi:hypothetical protein
MGGRGQGEVRGGVLVGRATEIVVGQRSRVTTTDGELPRTRDMGRFDIDVFCWRALIRQWHGIRSLEETKGQVGDRRNTCWNAARVGGQGGAG